ncbi:MAG: acetate--CoA ligase family protein [Desulfobacterales bacterium]|jgi:acyl-CoA synthetase (NDP forming)
MKIIDEALKENRLTLSEYESKLVLASYGLPVTREILIEAREELDEAAAEIGYPLVLKGCSADIAHKTEKGLIRVDIRNAAEAAVAFEEIMAGMNGAAKAVLVQQMISGKRELVLGLTRDPQFGPCVMFGLGGIFTEVLNDTAFRVAPLEKRDALEMMQEIKAHKILDAVRGMEAADRDLLAQMLVTVGRIGMENENIKEIDINPVIISGGLPIAVDALVVLGSEDR